MALPKRRNSKQRGRKRRTHYTAKATTVARCRECGTIIEPHRACPSCGSYGDRRGAIKTKAKKEKSEG